MQDRGLRIVVDGVGFGADEQHDGAARGERGERFVGGVEEEDPAFAPCGGVVVSGEMQWRGDVRMVGHDVQRNSPRATIVDVGGLELSVRALL